MYIHEYIYISIYMGYTLSDASLVIDPNPTPMLWYPRWILVALIVGSLMLSLSPRPMECFLPEASAQSCGWRCWCWCWCCRCRCGCGCCCCCRPSYRFTNQWHQWTTQWTQESRRYESARPDSSKFDLKTSGNFRVQDTVISIPSRFSPHPRSRRFGGNIKPWFGESQDGRKSQSVYYTNRCEQQQNKTYFVEKGRFMNYMIHFPFRSWLIHTHVFHLSYPLPGELEESWFRSTYAGRPVLAFFAGSPNSCARRGELEMFCWMTILKGRGCQELGC